MCVTYDSTSYGKKHAPTHSVTVTASMANGTKVTATETALKQKEAKHFAAQALWALLQDSTHNPSPGLDEEEGDGLCVLSYVS